MNDTSHLPPTAQSSWNTAGDLRDVSFDPGTDREYYGACYSDAWSSAHGDLRGYNPETYLSAARRHQAAMPGAVMKIFHREEPVGLMDLDPEREAEKGVGWVSLLYLKESYRNQGYGIQVLARAMFFYKKHGRSCLRLQVAEENGIACAFYRREGFRVIGEQRSQTGKLLLMERPLPAGGVTFSS